jgi:hypothetical protein
MRHALLTAALFGAMTSVAAAPPLEAQTIKQVVDSGSKTQLTVGQTMTMRVRTVLANGKPGSATGVIWSTDNLTVASVSTAGIVTAKAPGSAYIIATIGRLSGKWPISVIPKVVQMASCGGAFNATQPFPCRDTLSTDIPAGVTVNGFCGAPSTQVLPCIDSVTGSLSRGRVIGDVSKEAPPTYPCYTVAPGPGAMVKGAPCDTTKDPALLAMVANRTTARLGSASRNAVAQEASEHQRLMQDSAYKAWQADGKRILACQDSVKKSFTHRSLTDKLLLRKASDKLSPDQERVMANTCHRTP